MPGTTPVYGFPYPLGSDPVRNGDNDIRALAEDVETVIDGLGVYVDVPVPSSVVDNLTIGDGTIVARYTRIGNTVHFYGLATLGSTSVVTGALSVFLPVNANVGTFTGQSSCFFFTPSAPPFQFVGVTLHNTPSSLGLYAVNATATYGGAQQALATIPFTWGAGCRLGWNHVYEAA